MDIRTISAPQARPIRGDVLKRGLPASEVIYPGDDADDTLHLGAFVDGELVGIATFLGEACPVRPGARAWRLRGMATVPKHRDRGIGGALLEAGLDRVSRAGATVVWCNGRALARRFYERHGFEAVGNVFDIPHTGPHFLFVCDVASGRER
jgi:GNAT superfamily N-acetyltransferase